MEKREILVYIAVAAIIVAAVAIAAGNYITNRSYDVSVAMARYGPSYGGAMYPLQTSTYIINVSNKGSSKVSDMLVGFYLDGAVQSSKQVTLPPGQSVLFISNYTYPASGMYNFEAAADPGHLLNIRDRNSTTAYISTNISAPELPNIYTSLPNNGINYTQTFSLDTYGIVESAALQNNYNITLINRMFSPAENITTKIFENAYPYTYNVYGAYISYDNNASGYTAWIQGTMNSTLPYGVVSSFGTPVVKEPLYYGTMYYSPVNSTTSICSYYDRGWTKILGYRNTSGNSSTCLSIASSEYQPTESNVVIGAVSNNTQLSSYRSKFYYTNSSLSGSTVGYSRNGSISEASIFENAFGIFITGIKKPAVPLNLSSNSLSNMTCLGLTYGKNGTNVCSRALPTRNGKYNPLYTMVNSSYIGSNYIIWVYSLVNNTELTLAHVNAVALMGALNVTGPSAKWQNAFKSYCSLPNQTAISCKFLGFSNGTAELNLTNNLASSIRIKQMNCEVSGGFPNSAINLTIGSRQTAAISQQCHTIPVPEVAAQDQYILIINYTYNGTAHAINGILNVA